MEILLASNNAHKAREFAEILPQVSWCLPADRGLILDYEETASTFWENALGKALDLWNQGDGLPVVADDSGICIRALKGAPGVISARYGSEEAGRMLTDQEKNDLVLRQMDGVKDRFAWYVCALVLVLNPQRFFLFQETWEGMIARESRGAGGFGYDPLFYLPDRGCTSAQLLPEEKNHLSHRGRAGLRLAALLASLENHP